jgi:hypothetical protein
MLKTLRQFLISGFAAVLVLIIDTLAYIDGHLAWYNVIIGIGLVFWAMYDWAKWRQAVNDSEDHE